MTVIRVEPRRCSDCRLETQVRDQVVKEGYLVIVTECNKCGLQYQNAFKL